jgi:hypothetical protein
MRFLLTRRKPALTFSSFSTSAGKSWRQLWSRQHRFGHRSRKSFDEATENEIACFPIGPFGLAFWRDLLWLETEAEKQRSELAKAQEDMRYAKSVNAELGQRNTWLVERNSYLERLNDKLGARNQELESRNPYLEAENIRLQERNRWLFLSANAVREAAGQAQLLPEDRAPMSRSAGQTACQR